MTAEAVPARNSSSFKERAREISEDRFRLLVQSVTDYALFMLEPSGIICTWNNGAEKLKGYREQEILGQHFSKFYTEDDRTAGIPEQLLSKAALEGRAEAEGWRVRKDGTRFWALAVLEAVHTDDGLLIGFAKITRDMTQRHENEIALRESERRFRLLIQGVRDYAIFMLDPDGYVANWNSGAEAIKGYAADEIVGQHFSRFYTAADRQDGKPARVLEEAARNGRFAEEGWRVRKTGDEFWASVVLDAIRDENGQLIGFAKITRDMTEQYLMRKKLERAQEQLFQAQKMEAIGNLTGGIAHDFNNLLTVIRGSVELAERHAAGNARLTSLLRAVQAASGRAAELTHQLLAFSRRQPLQPEPVNLGQQLAEMARFLERSLRRDIRVELELDPGLSAVDVDPRQLELALLNVGLNARDAMTDGGTLRISAANCSLDDEISGLSGDFVAVSVSDQGVGIPAHLISKVVEPFFTTKEVGKGSGLGLSQAYGFAQQSGGRLTIQSAPGVGTVVTFLLPASTRSDIPQAARAEDAEWAPGGGHILVVEDDLDVALLTTAALQECGYVVTVVHGGPEALRQLELGGAFDLVFSDIIMPGHMNGVELAKAIRTLHPRLPVLLTTGYSDAALRDDARRFPIITKPFEVKELARRVAELVRLQGGAA